MPTFYFTFGQGQKLKDNYVKIEAPDRRQARDAMVNAYGMRWAFDYSEKEFDGQPEEFRLTEVPIGTENPYLRDMERSKTMDSTKVSSPTMITALTEFLRTRRHNAWLEDSVMKVFVRRSERVFDKMRIGTFEIANLDVVEEERNKGHFQRFVQTVELLLCDDELQGDIMGIYIENVQMPRFRDKLERMGFEPCHSSGLQEDVLDCFFSPLPIEFG